MCCPPRLWICRQRINPVSCCHLTVTLVTKKGLKLAWIESHQTLDKNGKLLELANRLGINRYQAIGHLHALWWWAIDNAEDGNLKRFSNATVTQACGWSDYIKDEIDLSRINEITNSKNHDAFVPALIECGFLDRKDEGIWIHNWHEYTHRYFKSVHKTERSKELSKKRVENFRNRNANVTLKKRHVTQPTVPDLTVPNHTNTTSTPPPAAPARFSKPSAQDITAYGKEIGFLIDGQQFVDHYEARGWQYKQGQPMKDWKAAVRTWRRNGYTLPFKPSAVVHASKPYVENLPKEDEIVSHAELKNLLSGLGKGIPK